ncbi:TonB-dependent receptor [Novosphingobium humi]|uniref:TonB-dependent receptor n=1 Tax=Novosphingobium humi TaxID=2282397 RepID=A0ABY7U1N0_9SPHN|nr:TonB-dependent receptor [Novosphingobium humi]WCT79221.1 TonB-dependent receptor [Novosphingobium humi]
MSRKSVPAVILPLLMAPAVALAQGEPQEAGASPKTTNAAEAGLADIIVTAQRRSENLQKAAIAVTAVSGKQLSSSGVTDINNLSKLVPALVVQPQGGATTNFYLRGVGSFGTNAFAENAVAFNFAGTYVARPTSPLGTLFDLERIEVVKGPQGTLYGRNATGGAINVIPKAPRLNATEGELTAEYGNYNTKKIAGAINIPLGATLALRVAGQAVDRDAYLSDGYDDEKGQAVRASLLFKPSDTFSLTLIGDYFRQRGKGVGSVLIPGATAPTAPALSERVAGSDPRSLAELTLRFPALVNPGLVVGPRGDGYMHNQFYGFTAIAQVDLGAATLTVSPAYRRSEPDFLSYTNGFSARVVEKDDQTSLEVRVASNGSRPFNYVLGAYYFHEKQDALNIFSQGLLQTGIFDPTLKTTSKAIFGQAGYSLTPTLRLIAGGRYTDEGKSLSTSLRQFSPSTPAGTPIYVTGKLNFNKFTWKAGVEWDAGPRSLVYANVATGFKAGGFFVSAVDNTTRPENLTAYTLGSKNRFFDNRVQLNIEAFYWNYRDQQVSFVGPTQFVPGVISPGGITVNAGNARMYGTEVELLFQATPNDRISVNVQYLNTKYLDFTYNALSANGVPPRSGCQVAPKGGIAVAAPARIFTVNCSGLPTLNSPKWSANLGYDRTIQLTDGLTLAPSLRARIEGSRYLALEYLPEERQGSYATIDMSLALQGRNDRWSVTGYVNNLTNETILASAAQRAFVPLVYGALRPPRTYGLRLSFNY